MLWYSDAIFDGKINFNHVIITSASSPGPKRAKFTFKLTYGSAGSTVVLGADNENILIDFMDCIEGGILRLGEQAA